MLKLRVIPRLDIKGPNLVKGIHLEGLRVLGNPEEFANYYYQNGADELIYMDVVASLFERNSLNDIISKTASKVFIPITVGGGLRTIDDIRNVLRCGADKVSLNTAAINNPKLISEASEIFGRSTIVVAIEAIKERNGDYMCYTDNGREITNKNVFDWAREVESLGAGEILLTSVDKDGTGEGFDLDMIKKVASSISIPLVVHGGFGSLDHLDDISEVGNLSGLTIASSFHYNSVEHVNKHELSENEGNLMYLKSGNQYSKVKNFSIDSVKKHLAENGKNIRMI